MMPLVIGGAARITPPTELDRELHRVRSYVMEGIRDFLEAVRDQGLAIGHFRGLLHAAIGRKLTRQNGATISSGVTWRELAGWLKLLRFDTELVREFGADPETISPRDRQRFWYNAIALAHVDTPEASAEAERLAVKLRGIGIIVGPSPSRETTSPSTSTSDAKPSTETPDASSKGAKRRKK